MARALLIILLFPCLLYSLLNGKNDHGIWLEQNINIKLPNKYALQLTGRERWGNDYKTYYNTELEVDLLYNLTSYLDLSPKSSLTNVSLGFGYCHVDILRINTKGHLKWARQNRPLALLILTSNFGDWIVRQRFQLQYDQFITKYNISTGVFRYVLLIRTPWKLTPLKLNPFVYNEWFFRINSAHKSRPGGVVGGWCENRLRFGLSYDICPDHIIADLWWQLRSLKQRPGMHPSYINAYMWGLGLNFFY